MVNLMVQLAVPTPTGSVTELVAVLEENVTVDEVNAAMKAEQLMNVYCCVREDRPLQISCMSLVVV